MSQAQQFLDQIKQDVSFFYKVQTLGRDVEAIVSFAAEQGFTFTTEEFMEAVRVTRSTREMSLSASELAALENEASDAPTQEAVDKHQWLDEFED